MHDVNEAFRIGDRVAVMKDGHVMQIGTSDQIIEGPANDYIEDFIQAIDRSKMFQANHIMISNAMIANLNEKLNDTVRKMERNNISSIFVQDKTEHVFSIITIDDAIKAIEQRDKPKGIILRVHVLPGLISEDLEGFETVEG